MEEREPREGIPGRATLGVPEIADNGVEEDAAVRASLLSVPCSGLGLVVGTLACLDPSASADLRFFRGPAAPPVVPLLVGHSAASMPGTVYAPVAGRARFGLLGMSSSISASLFT
jgi:hypothetical protein